MYFIFILKVRCFKHNDHRPRCQILCRVGESVYYTHARPTAFLKVRGDFRLVLHVMYPSRPDQALTSPSGVQLGIYRMSASSPMGWGGTGYQMYPAISFILLGYIEHVHVY